MTTNETTPIAKVAVIGFGTMGAGITQVCASAGIDVHVIEPHAAVIERDMARIEAQLAKAEARGTLDAGAAKPILARITPSTELDHARGAQLVIEAIPERLELKQQLITDLDEIVDADTLVATNTSALSVTKLAASSAHPERVLGLHWFNPPPVLPLVEVVRGERSSADTIARGVAFVTQVGKQPITCADTPGFVVNRILIPMLNDVVQLWADGLASAAEIDAGCRGGLNWPIGPLALCDLIGLDVTMHAAQALYDATREPRMAPPVALVRMVDAGKLGRKSGEGFYTY